MDRQAMIAYPDGWTCQCCGEEFHGTWPATYPPNPDEGTVCTACQPHMSVGRNFSCAPEDADYAEILEARSRRSPMKRT